MSKVIHLQISFETLARHVPTSLCIAYIASLVLTFRLDYSLNFEINCSNTVSESFMLRDVGLH